MHCWYIYCRGSGNKRRKFGSLCGVCFIHGIILLSHKTKIVVLQWHFLFIQYMHYIQYTEVYIVYIYLCSIGTKKTFSERVILSGGSSQGPLKQLGKSFLQLLSYSKLSQSSHSVQASKLQYVIKGESFTGPSVVQWVLDIVKLFVFLFHLNKQF